MIEKQENFSLNEMFGLLQGEMVEAYMRRRITAYGIIVSPSCFDKMMRFGSEFARLLKPNEKEDQNSLRILGLRILGSPIVEQDDFHIVDKDDFEKIQQILRDASIILERNKVRR